MKTEGASRVETNARRKELRVPSWDYSQPASYMVTVCVQDRRNFLGTVHNDVCHLSPAGCALEIIWKNIPARFPTVHLDGYVFMPNHIHGILHLHHELPGPGGCSLGDVMKWFKGASTRRYSDGVTEHGWPPYRDRFWQKNYFETIIRTDGMLDRFRQYIENNPSNWRQDSENIHR
jgi:putative transposase